jgi:hypothetical protein
MKYGQQKGQYDTNVKCPEDDSDEGSDLESAKSEKLQPQSRRLLSFLVTFSAGRWRTAFVCSPGATQTFWRHSETPPS